MAKRLKTARTLLSLLIGAIGVPQMAPAAQLPLAQYPAGSATRQPAPNVILTLDDSGSMQSNKGGDFVGERDPTSGMYALKDALQKTFSAAAQNIPDGAIRLAWNAMNRCQAIPDASGGCKSLNGMRTLDATHRANFLNWIGTAGQAISMSERLTASGPTPTHRAYIAAGDYLRNTPVTDINGPWANRPGVELGSPPLSCRRSYSILMTDGGWNWTFDAHGSDVARGPSGARGDADGVTQTLPDGTVYSVAGNETKAYRQTKQNSIRYNNTSTYYDVSTLADLAFYYWATDLTTLTNNLTPVVKQSGTQTFGTGGSAVTLPEYWNPRNNPATWQSMTTYTIGFRDAATWPTTGNTFKTYPTWDAATNNTFGGSFPELVTGAKVWPDPVDGTLGLTTNTENARKVELWHMAINSRGRFIPTQESADLVQAFKEIFGAIVNDAQAPVTGFANSSSSINRTNVTQYEGGYAVDGWKGFVRASTLAQGSGAATPHPGWVLNGPTTADKLDKLTAADIPNRLILSYRDKATGGGPTAFEWASDETYLSTAQKTLLKAEGTGVVTDAVGQQRLNYLRGDRSLESTATVTAQFRKRGSRQGDIVNSTIWYVAQPVSNYPFSGYLAFAKKHAKRLPMLYVGGNDGMLHGFSGVDGSEKIAYVPKGVIQNLPALTKADYVHRYFVDGSPFSGDVFVPTTPNAAPEWRTFLVGTLGAGGKGYFVMDVTTPGSIATDADEAASNPSNFLKANAGALVIMDKTAHPTPSVAITAGTESDDIGHIMARPVLEDGNPQKATQIVRMNNGRWAVVMGNGVNSTNERPVLLIQYLDGLKELLRIPAATAGANATGNGLSAPRLVDINGDGTPDVVYAGDLKGNLWKFNVSSATSSGWDVAAWGDPGVKGPLYSAVFAANNVSAQQPITAAPLVRPNDLGVGGLMVAFGTGRSLTEGDRTDTAVQSIYSVLDNTRYKLASGKVVEDRTAAIPTAVGTGVTNLQQQTVAATAIAGQAQSAARDFWTVSQNSVSYQGTGAKKGWYLNLPQSGERVLDQMSFFDSSNIIEVISEAPASGASTAEESCAPPPAQQKTFRTLLNIMDGKKPSVQVMDRNGDSVYDVDADNGVSRMTASTTENRLSTRGLEIRKGADGSVDNLRRLPELPLRPSWRQLQ